MNRKESTFSTTGSSSENKEELRTKSEQSLALLKLVYRERKSIKQSARYLKINYNSAKRIVKNFRKGRIQSPQNEHENLIDKLIESKDIKQNLILNENKIYNQDVNNKPYSIECSSNSYLDIQKKILIYNLHLERLNNEIKQNHMALVFLTNYAYQVYQSVKRGPSV
jgi:hypothetical protein